MCAHNPSKRGTDEPKRITASCSSGGLASGVNSERVPWVAVPSLFRAQRLSLSQTIFHVPPSSLVLFAPTSANVLRGKEWWKTKAKCSNKIQMAAWTDRCFQIETLLLPLAAVIDGVYKATLLSISGSASWMLTSLRRKHLQQRGTKCRCWLISKMNDLSLSCHCFHRSYYYHTVIILWLLNSVCVIHSVCSVKG